MGRLVMTQCWFTQRHQPFEGRKRKEDGKYRAVCRFCRQRVHSVDNKNWQLSGGFNIEDEVDSNAAGHIAVIDFIDNVVVARVVLDPEFTEAGLQAFQEKVRQNFGIGTQGNCFTLRLHRPKGKRKCSPPPSQTNSPMGKDAFLEP